MLRIRKPLQNLILILLKQLFARKLIHKTLEEESIQNELRAIHTLTWNKSHPNLVQIFGHGVLPNSNYYYIDMELCDLNLKAFIQRRWPTELDKSRFFSTQLPDWTRMIDVWTIMTQITSAIEFIHNLGLVHRDIKPDNSTFFLLP